MITRTGILLTIVILVASCGAPDPEPDLTAAADPVVTSVQLDGPDGELNLPISARFGSLAREFTECIDEPGGTRDHVAAFSRWAVCLDRHEAPNGRYSQVREALLTVEVVFVDLNIIKAHPFDIAHVVSLI